jgi:hypothetical protein
MKCVLLIVVLAAVVGRGSSLLTTADPHDAASGATEETPLHHDNDTTPEEHLMNGTEHGNDTEHEGEHDEVHRYQIAHFDFHAVASPFVVSIWIVIASAAKIGEEPLSDSAHCSVLCQLVTHYD